MVILEAAICNIKDELIETGYFKRDLIYEYCELIDKSGAVLPCYYIGNGNYKEIYDLDKGGSAYIRKRGDMTMRNITDSKFQVVSCNGDNPLLELVYSMRMVCSMRKKDLSDNRYSDELLIAKVIGIINKKQPEIDKVQSVFSSVNSINTDHLSIFNQEVKGIEKQISFELSYIAIDFNLIFRANLDCIKNACESYG